MTNNVKPEEKNNVPWRIAFTRKDLIAASWGSKKGADLLYHFLHRASWEAKNQKLATDLNDIKIQSVLTKALESASISRGCYHTYLKLFIAVGYVSAEPYSKDLTVHLAAIKSAFSITPEKPVEDEDKPKQPRSKRFKMNDCTFVSLPVEEFEKMQEERFKMNEMVQSLNDLTAKMNLLVQSLNQNPSIPSTPEARLRAIFDSRYALENRDALDFFSEGENVSCSQTLSQTTEEKKEGPSMSDWLAELDTKMDALDQQYMTDSSRLQENKAHQSSKPTLFQETAPAESAPKVVFNDMTKDVLQRDTRQPTPAEQRRQDAAEERHKIKMAARREQEIWEHYASLLETPVSQIIRDDFSKRAVKALIDGNATNEAITLTFNHLKNKKLTTTLTFISSNLNSVVSSQKPQPKPKSELTNRTNWTDEDWDNYRRHGTLPQQKERVQA